MSDYGNYCPVQMASEVLADRWTPMIIRELVLGNTRFNDIARALPGVSRSLLVQRLRHLERMAVVETWPAATGHGNEYHLTAAGRDLERVIDALSRWAIEWLFDDFRPQDVPPRTLMWWMRRRINAEEFPPMRTVIQFRHTAPNPDTIWFVLDHRDVSVCYRDPGFDVDLVASATTPAFAEVFQGLLTWEEAVARGRIAVHGAPRLAAALPRWFEWSPWAAVTRERSQRQEQFA